MIMKFIKNNKRRILSIFLLFVVLGTVIYFGSSVSADTTVKVVSGKYICFNPSNATYDEKKIYAPNNSEDIRCGSKQAYEAVKTINGKNAHCTEWKRKLKSMTYKQDSDWKKETKNAIIAGYLINLVESDKEYNEAEAYFMTGAVINTFFSKNLKNNNSANYYDVNEYVKETYKKGIAYGKSISLSKSLPKVSISTNSDVLSISKNVSENWLVSSKISVSGLKATYGGDSDKVDYTIVATASNGKEVKICSNLSGAGCKTEPIKLSGVSGTKDYYIFVKRSDLDVDDTITLKVSGSNKSVYPSSIRYKDSTKSGTQKLLVVDEVSVSRTVSKTHVFTVPSTTNHSITAQKVDENGQPLSGATLEIYKDDVNNKSNLLKSNNGSGYNVKYTSPLVIEEDDDFFKHDYYLVEKNGIDGYVFNSKPNQFYIKGSSTKDNTVSCYKKKDDGSSEKVDNEYCNFESYDYKCQNTSTNEIKDLDENKNCNFSVVQESSTENAEGTETGENEEEKTETVIYNKVCYDIKNNKVADDKYCNNKESYIKIWNSGGNLTVKHVNKRNLVRISKKATTGKDEVVGASLKVCTEEEYSKNKTECTPAKTIDGIEMSWVSGEVAYDFYGVPTGSYYIVEVTPPDGYIRAIIATKFRIDKDGTVTESDGSKITNEDFVNKNGAIVIDNELTSISISKQDVATSKELPGATISICQTYVDENNNIQMLSNRLNGECIEASLADGTVATWVSTDKPKKIEGLGFGTYYLVEKIAPDNYTTAESILFTLKEDGSLVDKDGKSLADNKLVMKDAPIKEVKTGNLSTYVVVGIFVVVVALGIGSYYYLKNNKTVINATVKKIRKRRIHKK